MLTPDKELWALALCVEKHHGANRQPPIARGVRALTLAGENGGIGLRKAVAKRFDRFSAGLKMPHGAI